MDNIKSSLNEVKQYKWFEWIYKKWDEYELTIWNVKWKFNCEKPQDFINILKITKKILSIYIKNEEDGKFYISKKNINENIYEDLDLDDWIIFDTTYLTNKWISKYIWHNNLQEYVKFINSLVWTNFVKDWKNIDIKRLDNLIEKNYQLEINSLFSKNNLILKKEFKNNSFIIIYDKIIRWNNPWLLQKLVNNLKNWKIEQSILSSVLLKVLIKNGYKIKELRDIISWNTYSENMEFNYFKNLLSKDFKVTFFDENYNSNVRNLKFIKEWNEIKIEWITKYKEKVNVWKIQIDNFYANML